MNDNYPTKSELDNQNNYNPNYESAHYPKFSDIHDDPSPVPIPNYNKYNQHYDKPNKQPKIPKVKKQKDYNYPKKQKKIKQPKQYMPPKQMFQPYMGMGAPKGYIAVPVGKPKYVPVIQQPQMAPMGQMPYYPGGAMYPQPYPYPYPYPPVYPYGPQAPAGNTVYVIPPGYERDYSDGYNPWGNLREDLDNLF